MPKPLPRTSLEPVCLALAEVIRQRREARGLSRGRLADLSALSRQMIAFVESHEFVPWRWREGRDGQNAWAHHVKVVACTEAFFC
jgi:hypothetical protein